MRQLIAELRRLVDNLQKGSLSSGTTEQHVTCMSLATAIAYRLALPSSPVSKAVDWYMVNVFSPAESIVGKINEQYMPIDVTTTMDLIRKIWLVRYAILHEPASPRTIRLVSDVMADASNELADIYRQILTGQHATAHYSGIMSMMSSELRTLIPVSGEGDDGK